MAKDEKWIGAQYDPDNKFPTDEDLKKMRERINEQCEKGSELQPIILDPATLKAFIGAMKKLMETK